MKYKLSVSYYYAPLVFIVLSLFASLLFITLTYFCLDFFYSNKYYYGHFYLIGLLIFFLVVTFSFRYFLKKEEIYINSEYIDTIYFGRILIGEIDTYRIRIYKGNTSLILNLKNGKKLSFGPRNRIKNSAIVEFDMFVEKYIEINNEYEIAKTNKTKTIE